MSAVMQNLGAILALSAFWLTTWKEGRALAIKLMIMAGLMLLPSTVFAHDHRHADLNDWFKTLQSHKGYCCDGITDALHLRDVDWDTQNKEGSHVRVRIPKNSADLARAIKGEEVETVWVDVPDDAVVDEPNKDGATLVWPIYRPMGDVLIRCFMPGPMT